MSFEIREAILEASRLGANGIERVKRGIYNILKRHRIFRKLFRIREIEHVPNPVFSNDFDEDYWLPYW